MKRLGLGLCVALLLVSCAGLPKPQGNESSLVVGNLVVDFPDGFFDLGPRTLDSNVLLAITDRSNNKSTFAYTAKDGYFYFAAVPGHTYSLDEWSVDTTQQNTRYSVGPHRLGLVFVPEAGKVVYLRHIVATFALPQKTGPVIARTTTYNYDIKYTGTSNPEGARQFIVDVEPESPWLTRDLVGARISY